jgi:aldehyde:ferredoxin oxidoreductase
MSDRGRHAAGRTGLGAVMGSKKLKAVAVHGTMEIPVGDSSALKGLYKEVCSAMLSNWGVQMTRKHGTAYFFESFIELGDTPVRNWTKATFPSSQRITGETITNTILKSRSSCYLCPESCFRQVEIEDEPYAMIGAGPEYQTVAALGSLCENDNLYALVKANDLCNRYGLDTISTGGCIAFAMECYEKEIIKKGDVGFDISFGNSTAILELVTQIAHREGLGDTLADGVKRASEKLDRGSQDFAIHVRGLEVPMHDPRAFNGIGIGYAVGPTGARHTEFLLIENQNLATRNDVKTRARVTMEETNIIVGVNTLGVCFKPLLGPKDQLDQIAKACTAVTGIRTTIDELKLVGNRIFNLKRAFTLRHGSTIKEDTLPKRLLTIPLGENGCKEHTLPLKEMLDDYYELRGWDARTGKPKRETLEGLGLTDIADDLWS